MRFFPIDLHYGTEIVAVINRLSAIKCGTLFTTVRQPKF